MANILIRLICSGDIPAVAAIHVEGWQTAYFGFLPVDFLTNLSLEKNIERFQKWIFGSEESLVALMAEVDGQPAGFLLGGPNEDEPLTCDAEVYKLFIRPNYQGLGIGRSLLHEAAETLVRQGYHSVAIWVFEKARSGRFYEKLGGQIACGMMETFGGQETPAVAYSWALDDLMRRTA
jgi:GNAT superfamily N-acetyltransferase